MNTIKKIQIGQNGPIYDLESKNDSSILTTIASMRAAIEQLQQDLTDLENSLDEYGKEDPETPVSTGSY